MNSCQVLTSLDVWKLRKYTKTYRMTHHVKHLLIANCALPMEVDYMMRFNDFGMTSRAATKVQGLTAVQRKRLNPLNSAVPLINSPYTPDSLRRDRFKGSVGVGLTLWVKVQSSLIPAKKNQNSTYKRLTGCWSSKVSARQFITPMTSSCSAPVFAVGHKSGHSGYMQYSTWRQKLPLGFKGLRGASSSCTKWRRGTRCWSAVMRRSGLWILSRTPAASGALPGGPWMCSQTWDSLGIPNIPYQSWCWVSLVGRESVFPGANQWDLGRSQVQEDPHLRCPHFCGWIWDLIVAPRQCICSHLEGHPVVPAQQVGGRAAFLLKEPYLNLLDYHVWSTLGLPTLYNFWENINL